MKQVTRHLAAIVFIVVALALAMGCDDKNDPFTSGTYRYAGYNLESQKVTEGEISITLSDSVIEGEKNIGLAAANVSDVQDTGMGSIQGHVKSDGTIEIYLMNSPGPYLVIRGSFDNGGIRGKRYYCLEVLEADIGTFVAEKI